MPYYLFMRKNDAYDHFAEKRKSEERAEFMKRLRDAKNMAEAVLLYSDSVPPGHHLRPLYSNLGFFLMSNRAPNGACKPELEEYLRLMKATEAENPDSLKSEIAAMEKAILERRF